MTVISLIEEIENVYVDDEIDKSKLTDLAYRVHEITKGKSERSKLRSVMIRIITSNSEFTTNASMFVINNKNTKTCLYYINNNDEMMVGYYLTYKNTLENESFFCGVFCDMGHPMILCKEFLFKSTKEDVEFVRYAHPFDDMKMRIIEFGLFQ